MKRKALLIAGVIMVSVIGYSEPNTNSLESSLNAIENKFNKKKHKRKQNLKMRKID